MNTNEDVLVIGGCGGGRVVVILDCGDLTRIFQHLWRLNNDPGLGKYFFKIDHRVATWTTDELLRKLSIDWFFHVSYFTSLSQDFVCPTYKAGIETVKLWEAR